MRRFFLILTLGIGALLLTLTLMPVPGETESIYIQYLETSNLYEAEDGQDIINIAKKKLEEAISNNGRLIFTFPLEVGDHKVIDGDMFDSWGMNDWRKLPRKMADGSIRPSGKHGGTDITVEGNPTNIKVVSMCDGIVKAAGFDGGSGFRVIVIEEKTGLNITYMHMTKDSLMVKKGDTVDRGQQLGVMGMTGYSTGIHLHVSITYPGTDLAFETVSVGALKNGLDMYDPRYFSYTKESFPINFQKNENRLASIIIE